jgi:cell wall-associated NlpC family hydrolase
LDEGIIPASHVNSWPRVNDDDLPTGLPAATLHRTSKSETTLGRVAKSNFRFVTAFLLLTCSVTGWAQTAPVEVPADVVAETLASAEVAVIEAKPSAAAASPSAIDNVKARATEAAAATLTALLPRLAASDTVPLLDRSALVAGDLSRLLARYDLTRTGVVAQEEEGGKIQSLLKRALTLMGTPYRWGGTSPDSGFDCSGLVGYVFQTALGIELPRVSREMAAKADAELIKNREDLKQGDLVFFGPKGRVNHVGIYVGEGRFLHSPSRGKDVRVDSLTTGYWGNRFLQARRVAL